MMASHDSLAPAKRYCLRCKSFVAPAAPVLFALDRAVSPGEISAASKWQELEKELAQVEHRRAEQGEAFFKAPFFFPWCSRYTLSDDRLQALRRAVQSGDDAPLQEAEREGFEFNVDYANGDIRRVFVLCARKNEYGHCESFQPNVESSS